MYYHNDELSDDGGCAFDRRTGKVLRIRIGRNNDFWQSSFCHELGHAYMIPHQWHRKVDKRSRISYNWRLRYEVELLAWQIGKAMCKPEYWNEELALSLLKTYWRGEGEAPTKKITPVYKMKTILYKMKKIGVYRENLA